MSRVIVVGSINADLVARAPHHPRPGETVAGTGFARHPGGKGANQAVAAALAEVPTAMVGSVGDDPFGVEQVAHLTACGVDVGDVVSVGDPTGVALIVVDDAGENTIVVVPGANAALEADRIASLAGRDGWIAPGDVVVAQFETPLGATREAFAAARAVGARTVLNPAPSAPVPADLLALCDVLVVNEIELGQAAGRVLADPPQVEEVIATAEEVRGRHGPVVVATLGADGVVAVADGPALVVPAHPVDEVVDTTGAGDCFVGSLAARTAGGDGLADAVAYAVVAAAICVQRPGAGASMPRRSEVEGVGVRGSGW